MKKLIIIAAMSLALINQSCKKPETTIKQDKSYVLSGENRSVAPPSVTNGILTFSSMEHYNDWTSYLDQACKRDSTSEDTTMTEDVFKNIEQGISFTSLRKILRDRFNQLDAIGWSTLEEIPTMHHVRDQTILSTLNQYGEVKIGNEIISYANKDFNVIIKDAAVLPKVRNFLATGNTDIMSIYLDGEITQANVGVEVLNKAAVFESVSGAKTTGYGTPLDGKTSTDPCNDRKVTIKDYRVIDDGSFKILFFTVNWGDGSSSTQTSNSLNLTHIYSAYGSYTISISAISTSGSSAYAWGNVPIVLTSGCNKASRNAENVKVVADGTMAFKCYYSVTIEQKSKRSIRRNYGSTESYQKWNGKWRTHKADAISIEACMEVLNTSCSPWFNKCGITRRAKDKFVQDGFNISGDFGWNVSYGNHAIVHNGSWVTLYNPLLPCQ